MVAVTVILFALARVINHWLFARLEFGAGVHWIYLPAGVRLLATLLFAEAGAVGLLLVSWPLNFFWLFPGDPERAFVGGIVAAAVPYALYLVARRVYGLQASLANLTPRRLLLLAAANAAVGPLLLHLYLAARGRGLVLAGLVAMSTGDLVGTLAVLYGFRAILQALAPGRR